MAITKVRLPNQIQISNDVDWNAKKITNLANPVNAQDAATKVYVDNAIQGLDYKNSVRAATTSNITLTNTQTVDGVVLAVNDRVLVKNQSTGSENGIYLVKTTAWVRSSDLPSGSAASAFFVFVEEGTTNHDTGWICSSDRTDPDYVGQDALSFVQFSKAGVTSAGAGLINDGINIAMPTVGTAGTYTKVTTDAYGRITAGSQMAVGDLSSIAANTFVGNNTGSAAAPIAMTVAQAQTLLGLGSAAYTASSAYATASHVHGNITNAGAIGSTANLPVITTTSGVLTTGSFGTTANTFCQGNDSRLSDARTPTAHVLDSATHTISGKTAGQILMATAATTYAFTTVSGDVTINGSGVTAIGAGKVTNSMLAGSIAISKLAANTISGVSLGNNLNALTITTGNGLNGTVASYNGSAAVTISHLGTDGNMHVPATSTTNARKALIAGSSAGSFGWQTLDMSYLPDSVFKKSVKAASTANIASLSGPMTIDGISLVTGDRVLIKDQTTTSLNGIYVVAAGEWPRAVDADSASEIAGAVVNVYSGTVNGGKLFTNTFKITDTVGTTAMLWDQIITNISQTQKTFFAAPNGANGRPTFRTIVASDIPTLNQNTTGAAGSITGQTTVGINLVKLANPSAVTFLRINADNTVSTLDAATFRTAIGAGTSSTVGTVTSVSVVSANGFSGSVATNTTTPAITLTTTITGMLKGNGTAISAATLHTDYLASTSLVMNENLTVTAGVGTLANNANASSIQVYVNGIRQNPGVSNDYTVGGTGNKTITFNTGNVPEASDIIVVDYIKA